MTDMAQYKFPLLCSSHDSETDSSVVVIQRKTRPIPVPRKSIVSSSSNNEDGDLIGQLNPDSPEFKPIEVLSKSDEPMESAESVESETAQDEVKGPDKEDAVVVVSFPETKPTTTESPVSSDESTTEVVRSPVRRSRPIRNRRPPDRFGYSQLGQSEA